MEIITYAMLKELKSNCDEAQLAIFEREFPDGAEVTLDNVRKARELELDVILLVYKLAPASIWDRCKAEIDLIWPSESGDWSRYKAEKDLILYRTLRDIQH